MKIGEFDQLIYRTLWRLPPHCGASGVWGPWHNARGPLP